MPRKRKPITILRIESMSTGREYRPNIGVDDFTGQPIESAVDTTPIRPIADPQIAIDARKQLIRDNQRALLEAVLPQVFANAPRTPKAEVLVAPSIAGKRAIVISGIALHMTTPRWRR